MTVQVDDPNRAFLDRFPNERRSTVANLFLDVVRSSTSMFGKDPDVVLKTVVWAIVKRCNEICEPERRSKFQEVLRLIGEHPDEALAFAGWALRWDTLPTEERAALKEQHAERGKRAWMATLPTTEKQSAFLHGLGYRGPPPANRLEASDLIDRLSR